MATHSSILACEIPWTVACEIPWTEESGGYSPWVRKESDKTEQLHFHFLHPQGPCFSLVLALNLHTCAKRWAWLRKLR